jgi:hypothetical protein
MELLVEAALELKEGLFAMTAEDQHDLFRFPTGGSRPLGGVGKTGVQCA